MGESNLSYPKQVSKGGKLIEDKGDPFRLLGYNCHRLKLEKVSLGSFEASFGSLFTRAAPNNLLNLAKFNFTIYKQILIY